MIESPVAEGAARVKIERVALPSSDWDDFVRASAESTFCHLAGWHGVMKDALGAKPHYLEARDESGALRGVLPLVRVKSVILGDYLVSMPFLNHGGALGDDAVRTELAHEAVRLGAELGTGIVELRSRKREASTLQPTERKITVVLRLPETDEELWDGLRSKLRSQIRRPMKEEMETRTGAEQLGAFYSIFASNMRDLGTPVLPRRFFEEAARRFPEQILFMVVRHRGTPVAAGCGFFHHDEFEIEWASALRDYNPLAPNMLLYWELMREAIRRGSRSFNFGRCTPGEGTHRFKLQWGSENSPLGWSTWSADGGSELPSPDRPIFKVATEVWRRLPLWSTNRLGPVVSRWIP